LPISSEDGIAMPPLVDTLKELGYDGWFTVHQPLLEKQTVQDVIWQSTKFISNHFKERT
jgi:sugar phosphate isomerase/epimerase